MILKEIQQKESHHEGKYHEDVGDQPPQHFETIHSLGPPQNERELVRERWTKGRSGVSNQYNDH
jgi:hypothetical protein